jgi:hypothetical protein
VGNEVVLKAVYQIKWHMAVLSPNYKRQSQHLILHNISEYILPFLVIAPNILNDSNIISS